MHNSISARDPFVAGGNPWHRSPIRLAVAA